MKISAVIPLYNKAHVIDRAVKSVFDQIRLPDVLVVVDDGSTDESALACRAALAEAPLGIDCRLISQKNSGVSVARNVGADATATDLIVFLDADDEWLPTHLAEIELLAETFPEAGLLSTRKSRPGLHGQFVPDSSAMPAGFFGLIENGLQAYSRGYGILHTSSIAITRPAWIRSGGFPRGERKSQDMHLWLRLLLSEPFAHSDARTSIFHEEDSGVSQRYGVVPAHFSYFLDSEDGRKNLSNSNLAAFLVTNLANSIAGHRLRGDEKVVAELLRMSGHLSFFNKLRLRALSKVPRRLLGMVAARRRRRRKVAEPR
jgi:glycosyltransferase involved in cell wall biosynthesis